MVKNKEEDFHGKIKKPGWKSWKIVRLRNLSSEKMGNLRSSPVNRFLYSDTEVYTVGT